MKFIMYHYLKSKGKIYPNFNNLKNSTFLAQLKKFRPYFLTNKSKFDLKKNNVVFTFDDGLKEHYQAALTLKKFNATGIFFINTMPYKKKDLCNTHKAHLLLGKAGGENCVNFLNKKNPLFFKNLNIKHIYKFDENLSKKFKFFVNHSNNKYVNKILNEMMVYFKINHSFKNYYLKLKEIKELKKMGMIIGNHGVAHKNLSFMSYNEQMREIKNSKEFLEELTGTNIHHFAYPFGNKLSFNKDTFKILKKLNYKYAFTSEKKYIFKNKLYNIPRIDCVNINI